MVERAILSPKNAKLSDCTRKITTVAQIQENLTTETLTWRNNGKKYTLALEDLVGVSPLAGDRLQEIGNRNKRLPYNQIKFLSAPVFPSSEASTTYFVVRAYPLIKKMVGKRRQLQEYYFACPDVETRSQWVRAIDNTLRGLPIDAPQPKPRHLQVLLNPASGKKKAWHIFQQVRTVWDKSNIKLTVNETTSAEQVQQILQTLSLEIDGLVIIGGDGTLHDVINGLMNRHDWKKAIQIPIGIIGAGTGNGLCKTLLELASEPYDPMSAAFLIAKGKMRPLDLAMIKQERRRYYSVLSVSWGFVSDVDIESDRWRFLGSLKNTIYAFIRILSLRSYQGRLAFVAVPNSIAFKNQCKSLSECYHCAGQELATDTPPTQVIEDEFVLLWAMNVVWAAHDLQPTPHAHLSDGAMDLLIARKGISRSQLLKAFLLCASGKHLNTPYIEYYKVRSFQLEPLTERGILAVDGERVDYSSIQVRVLRGVARVFGA